MDTEPRFMDIQEEEQNQMDTEPWIMEIEEERKGMAANAPEECKKWKKQSIYKVTSCVTEWNRKDFMPQTVSFGPYHHGETHLRAMEEHKRRALLHFLHRFQLPFARYCEALHPIVEDLKSSYDQLDDKWENDTNAFLKLMILDGCFILEIMLYVTGYSFWLQDNGQVQARPQGGGSTYKQETVGSSYDQNDPIFSKHGKLCVVPFLRRDMLMLENQLPLSVLRGLVGVAAKQVKTKQSAQNEASSEDTVVKLILKFLGKPETISQPNNSLHILDVHRKSFLVKSERKFKDGFSIFRCCRELDHSKEGNIIRSASELHEAGVKFKKANSERINDVSFQRGVLRLPEISVDDGFKSLYLNLMAFERFHSTTMSEISSYIFFLDKIIDSPADVSLLHSSGIIINALGSDEAVAKLFNKLSRDVAVDTESKLEMVHKEVSTYCQKRCNKWRAYLMHNYITNPWVVISVAAAIFLFALTIVQTVYSVISNYK